MTQSSLEQSFGSPQSVGMRPLSTTDVKTGRLRIGAAIYTYDPTGTAAYTSYTVTRLGVEAIAEVYENITGQPYNHAYRAMTATDIVGMRVMGNRPITLAARIFYDLAFDHPVSYRDGDPTLYVLDPI